MKPKGSRGKVARAKIVKKEISEDQVLNSPDYSNIPESQKPSVEIVSCISFQKFRYHGENRPGKKYQEKEFMTLKLCNLQDKVVRVVIICTDADNRELIHPNGLVGKDCDGGIYDKEYAVTKSQFSIRIPYLRTERIKTKKNEHEKIQEVLRSRASHLPSPYKERCLSQCTDKYTSARKFDTTKVCLGVIITVQSHHGMFNGSLHAISHVVRNASEKTALEIFKLSQSKIPMDGGKIDIFTTEAGPAIEPEKYQVYVLYPIGEDETYRSPNFTPGKEDILYKRVITYDVPALAHNPNMMESVEAELHLECPMSNQYCKYPITYVPNGEISVSEDLFNGLKRVYDSNDFKPPVKKMKLDHLDTDGNSESIKAKLNTKLKARQELPETDGTVYIENVEGFMERSQQQQDSYNQGSHVVVCHQDPQTGESSYYIDMDANTNNNVHNSVNTIADNGKRYSTLQHYTLRNNTGNHVVHGGKSPRGKAEAYQAHAQQMEVVATGYSDAVPPNTTVLIYTTSNGVEQQVTIDEATGQLLQGNQQVIISENGVFSNGAKHQAEVVSVSHSAATPLSSSVQVIRREAIAEKRMTDSQEWSADRQRSLHQSYSDHAVTPITTEANQASVRTSYSAGSVRPSVSSGKSIPDRLSPVPASSPSAIPPIRRMLIPSKTVSSKSPWDVGNDEESDADYHTLVEGMLPYDNYRQTRTASNEVKREPFDSEAARNYRSPHQQQNYHHSGKQMSHLEDNENPHPHPTSNSTEANRSEQDNRENSSGESNMNNSLTLNSTDNKFLAHALAENLPTLKVFECAEGLNYDSERPENDKHN